MRDIEAQAAKGVRFHDIAEIPADGVGLDGLLEGTDPKRRHHTLDEAAEDAAEPDIDFVDQQGIALVPFHVQGDVVDADHLATVDIDNLLVQEVALHTQHVLIGVVRVEALVGELDSVGERDAGDLVVADREPGAPGGDQKPVNPGGVDEGDQGSIFHPPDAAMFQVIDRHPEQFGEKNVVESCFCRHAIRQLPSPNQSQSFCLAGRGVFAHTGVRRKMRIGLALHPGANKVGVKRGQGLPQPISRRWRGGGKRKGSVHSFVIAGSRFLAWLRFF